ncbi:MAG: OsmC family protein [Mycobacteriales bacterium]
MAAGTERSIELERIGLGRLRLRNARGGEITVGTGDDADFSPVELLLAAIGGCTAVDVDYITSKRADPEHLIVSVRGDRIRDESGGNRMINIETVFDVAFPDGADGDAARSVLPRALQQSHDRLCTVSRTVESGTPIISRLADAP